MDTLSDLQSFINNDSGLRALLGQYSDRLYKDQSHDLSHCLRVALWTTRLGTPTVDIRAALAAALCHDLISVRKNSPLRGDAARLAAAEARSILPDHGFNNHEVDEICQAIRDHSYSGGEAPGTDLGRALQDADRLDALGAIGIMRAVTVGVSIGAAYFDMLDPWATGRPLNENAFMIDHFFTKLLRIGATMHTPAARVEAERRTQVMERFVTALAAEIGLPRPV